MTFLPLWMERPGERDRLCRFHRHRDLAQIIRRNHNRLCPAWSFEAVTTPVRDQRT